MKKKIIVSAVLALIMLTMTAAPAFAHGHRSSRTVSYTICTTESCALTGNHWHSGKIYSAHYYGDGHDYHDYCDIASCSVSGYHEHDGSYHFGHTSNDGHSYHRSGRGHH